MHTVVGVALAYRVGSRLDNKNVMVYEDQNLAPIPVQASEIDESLTGASFFLFKGAFRAFEYDRHKELNLSNDFLREFRSYLLKHNLDGQWALSRLHCRPTQDIEVYEDVQDEDVRDHEVPMSQIHGLRFIFEFVKSKAKSGPMSRRPSNELTICSKCILIHERLCTDSSRRL